MNITVEIERNPSIRGYSIWITRIRPDGQCELARNIELEFYNPTEGVWEKPTLELKGRDADDFLQSFANALVHSGFKSNELKNVNQEISAIKYHLEDMRSLVFKQTEVK